MVTYLVCEWAGGAFDKETVRDLISRSLISPKAVFLNVVIPATTILRNSLIDYIVSCGPCVGNAILIIISKPRNISPS